MKHLRTLLCITILVAVIYIIFNDVGDSIHQSSGAGDIWWTDTADIDRAYRSIIEKKQ
jgi:hypothetical protein